MRLHEIMPLHESENPAGESPVLAAHRAKVEGWYDRMGATRDSGDPRDPLKLPNCGNTFLWKGQPYWSGAFDTRDGQIVAAYPYYIAHAADFHHSGYFAGHVQDGMEEGDYQFFFVDKKGLQTFWREDEATAEIRVALDRQITRL